MIAGAQVGRRQVSLTTLLGGYGSALAELSVAGVQIDSRKVEPGDLFLAVPGETHDGRQFIEQAVASGAVAVVSEPPVAGYVDALPVPLLEVPDLQFEVGLIASRFYDSPSASMHMIGVTGTNGKTTTTRLIAQLGRLLGSEFGVIGTLGATLDDRVVSARNTTPDPVALQAQLAQWRDAGVNAVGMEVSSHALMQGRVSGVEFESAVFTNLSRDHLDYHGSMEAYGRAKLKLFTSEGLRHAIVNLDDDYAKDVMACLSRDVIPLGFSVKGHPDADLRVENLEYHDAGVRGYLVSPWGEGGFSSPLQGEFNVGNLIAAIASVVLAGNDFHATLDVVAQLKPVAGRMQAMENDAGLQVVVDYAHTPDALEQVLRALRPHVSGSLITVFGCGGDRDEGKRPAMGQIASSGSDRVIITSDNPRSESPQRILFDIEVGCSGDCRLVVDRGEAIALAIAEAEVGDCVLIAGKGHEDYQLIDGERLEFSDEAHALAALAKRSQQ
ncbi:MAG: UDP-N-acetylmuramoyl-L-alanyl-D-glutamate--2,6-diaminopimelate ligase [Halioglobus sp.]